MTLGRLSVCWMSWHYWHDWYAMSGPARHIAALGPLTLYWRRFDMRNPTTPRDRRHRAIAIVFLLVAIAIVALWLAGCGRAEAQAALSTHSVSVR